MHESIYFQQKLKNVLFVFVKLGWILARNIVIPQFQHCLSIYNLRLNVDIILIRQQMIPQDILSMLLKSYIMWN